LAPQLAVAAAPSAKPLADWPHVTSAVKQDAAIEARIKQIVGGMTLAQKVGQMTQPEIKFGARRTTSASTTSARC
jgi:beta-glucosidase